MHTRRHSPGDHRRRTRRVPRPNSARCAIPWSAARSVTAGNGVSQSKVVTISITTVSAEPAEASRTVPLPTVPWYDGRVNLRGLGRLGRGEFDGVSQGGRRSIGIASSEYVSSTTRKVPFRCGQGWVSHRARLLGLRNGFRGDRSSPNQSMLFSRCSSDPPWK
jgi:hypothetical protein